MNRSYPSFKTDLHCRSALLIRLPSLPSSSATCSAHTQLHGDFSKWMEWTYFCITGISERGVFLTSSGGTFTKQLSIQNCAEKRNCFSKHKPGVAGCGWLQQGRNFLHRTVATSTHSSTSLVQLLFCFMPPDRPRLLSD